LKSAILYCTTFCYITQWLDGNVIIWLPCYLLTHGMTSHYVRHMAQQDSVVLSLRLPAKLVKRLDTLAEQELRTRVNMIHVLLQEALDNREKEK
jgi:hypothetical protein